VLATPYSKGAGLAPGFGLAPRSWNLWIRVLISAMLNSLKKGRSGKLGPGYNHILVMHSWSGWIQQLKKCL
jgi:hypothetical protein